MKKVILVLAMLMAVFNLCFADSPLTSTNFYKAYLDVPVVKAASKSPNKLSPEAKAYLFNEKNPLDVKMALINAVGWHVNGQSTYKDYIQYCLNHFPKQKYGIAKNKILKIEDLFKYASREQRAVLVYLYAMSDYTNTKAMYSLMQKAMEKPMTDKQSFMLPMGLVYAQNCLDDSDNWSNIYSGIEYYVNGPKNKDMRPKAIKIIMDYIDLYKE